MDARIHKRTASRPLPRDRNFLCDACGFIPSSVGAIMVPAVSPEFERFISAQRKAKRMPIASRPLRPGEVSRPVPVKGTQAVELLRAAAKAAAGLHHATPNAEVIWVRGDSELAVNLGEMDLRIKDGLLLVRLPVRCDQVGKAVVEVPFVVGSRAEPAGLYTATLRRPKGPHLIVEAWGEALVAFGWQCVLGVVSGVAAAVGKDQHGSVLVPAELTAVPGELQILPMARHRFSGPSGLDASAGRDP